MIRDDGLKSDCAASAGSLFLLPGMGADARMFRPQQRAFPELQVLEWIPPEPRETIVHYAGRLSERVLISPGSFLGGASFGGVVALEMAALLPVKKCLLIGSLRSPAGLRLAYRPWRRLSSLLSLGPVLARGSLWPARYLCGPSTRGTLRQLADADGRFLSWAARALLDWIPSANIAAVAVSQIHGQRDWLLPANLSQADFIVPQAGHLLSLTHPQEVNDFLRRQMTPGSE